MNFAFIYIYMINKNLTVNLQSLQFLRMKYQSLNSILLYFDLYIFLFFFFFENSKVTRNIIIRRVEERIEEPKHASM